MTWQWYADMHAMGGLTWQWYDDMHAMGGLTWQWYDDMHAMGGLEAKNKGSPIFYRFPQFFNNYEIIIFANFVIV